MPLYTLDELRFEQLANEWRGYVWENPKPLMANAEEGLIYLFTQWLEIVTPDDFGKGDGLAVANV